MDESAETSATNGTTTREGGPAALAVLLGVGSGGLFWRQIGDALAWWWNTVTGWGSIDGIAPGQLIIFALGLLAALLATLIALVVLERALSVLRDLGQAFAHGWKRSSEHR